MSTPEEPTQVWYANISKAGWGRVSGGRTPGVRKTGSSKTHPCPPPQGHEMMPAPPLNSIWQYCGYFYFVYFFKEEMGGGGLEHKLLLSISIMLNICKALWLLVSSLPQALHPRHPSTRLLNQSLRRIRCGPFLSCGSPASSIPACNARVVFKTNENGTQEAKWIHLALCSLLPCCYLFLCISLEATFVNMAAEKPQARENCFCTKQIT